MTGDRAEGTAAPRCRSCRTPLRAGARFCGACGQPTREHLQQSRRRAVRTRRTVTRAALAVAIAFAGALFGIVVEAALASDDAGAVALGAIAVFGAAFGSAAVMRGVRASLAGLPRWPWWLAAAPAAAVSVAVGVGYVHLLLPARDGLDDTPTTALWIAAVVVAPIGEEWLCRGAAWHACRHLANARTTWLVTSILFAFLHGLGGLYLLELPHRVVAGLVFGWLRWRSGSLGPGILAHALHNTAALTMLAS